MVEFGAKDKKLKINLKIGVIREFDFSLLLGNDFNKITGITIECKYKFDLILI